MSLTSYYHNYSYWIKQILASTIIITTIISKNNTSQLIMDIQFFSIRFFIILILVSFRSTLKPYWIRFNIKKFEEQDLDDSIAQLAQKMESSISKCFIVPDYNSAFVFGGKDLIIGASLKKMLSQNEVIAIMAHEFSHEIRDNFHTRILILGTVITYVFFLIFFLHLSRLMSLIIVFTCFYLIMSVFFWYRECDCDANAMHYVDLDDLANGLFKVYKGRVNAFSFNHPSPNFRITRLKCLKKRGKL